MFEHPFTNLGLMAVAKALTKHRHTRVVELVTSGLSYDQAAAKVGCRSRSAAWKAFHAGSGGP